MLHEEQRSRGLLAPRTPRGRAISPAPFLRLRKLNEQGFSACGLGKTEREHTEAMKTKKRAVERMHSLTASFLSFFPDAKHPAVGVPHRPARGAAVPQPARKAATFICEGVSACGSAGTQFAKFQSFFCTDVCACYVVSPGPRLRDMNCQFRHRVKGRCPLWGAGVKPRMVSHASPGNCLKDADCCFRRKGAGSMTLLEPRRTLRPNKKRKSRSSSAGIRFNYR